MISFTFALAKLYNMQLAASHMEGIEKIPVNFVFGKERSGTTLLQVMLNAHPSIAAPPESRFIVLLYGRYGSIKHWSEKNINDFCNDLFREGLFRSHWSMDKSKLRDELLSVKDSLSYPSLCKIVFLQWAGREKQVTLLFDKNPVYYYFLPLLGGIFPEAKYIHLVRDYRANIASHQRVFKIKRAGDLAYRWVKTNEQIEDKKNRAPEKYFTLKYEQLVANPKDSIREICSFLGIPFSEKMTGDHTQSIYPVFRENKKERFREMHGSLFQPVGMARIDEWKQKLSSEEIAEAEAVAGKYGAKYGYLPISGKSIKLSTLRLLFIKTKYLLIKSTYKIVFSNLSLYYFVKQKVWKDF